MQLSECIHFGVYAVLCRSEVVGGRPVLSPAWTVDARWTQVIGD